VSRGTPDRRTITRALVREVAVWIIAAAAGVFVALFLLGWIKP
jgi:hypothetical protein